MVIGDLDLLDGHMDVAVAGYTMQNRIWVLLGNGDGSLEPPEEYIGGERASSMAIGDLDRDAVPDLAVANARRPTPNL